MALTATVVVALAACSKGATPGAGDVAQGPSGSRPTLAPPDPATGGVGTTGGSGSGGSQGTNSGGTNNSGSSGSGGGSSQAATTDDLKVFGYATVDEGQLAGEVSLVAETVAHLSSDAARNLDAAKADAATLLQEARTLETDANNATNRQQPLEPSDPTLVSARADAIDAFGLTADYAAAVVDLANAALNLNLSELLSVAQQAATLEGTSAELETAFEDLNHELTAWAQDHPGDAAKALALYDK